MATTFTTNLRLRKPGGADRYWDVPLNANADALDGLAAVGGLAVTPSETPSASLACRITAGSYQRADGTVASFPGTGSLALAPNATSSVWLTDAGVATVGSGLPASPHLPLARVRTDAGSVVEVLDARVPYRSTGANAVFVSKAGDTIGGPFQVTPASGGTATLAIDPAAGRLGFFGVAPASQAPALSPLADGTGGTAGNNVAPAGASYSQATLNDNLASLTAKVNALIAALKRHGLMSS